MRVFSLAINNDEDLSVELFSTAKAAQNSFMRDLRENYADMICPTKYDVVEISNFLGDNDFSLIWSITEHDIG